jgi:hypothetical protein
LERYSTEQLEAMLAAAGRLDLAAPGIVNRRPSEWISTHPSEVLICRRRDGTRVEVLMKYSTTWGPDPYGHHGRLARESRVYATVLDRDPATTARLYGTGEDARNRSSWLAVEHLAGAERIHLFPDAMPSAARWIGEFHARQEATLSPGPPGEGLPAYDAAYYRDCARRTALLAGRDHQEFPWLRRVCERIDEVAALLLEASATVVHGEYYPKNILVRDGVVHPVDWETATLGAGEIDLACLTERWPEGVRRACERAYVAARWNGRPPDGFSRRLDAACSYLMLRWLGDLTIGEERRWRFEALHAAAGRLGLL